MQLKHAIYAGSFDPVTAGHLHIVIKSISAIVLLMVSNAYAGHGSFIPTMLGDMSGLNILGGASSQSLSTSGQKLGIGKTVKEMKPLNLKNRLPASEPKLQKGIRIEKVDVAMIRRKIAYFETLARQKKESEERKRAIYMRKAAM